MAGKIKKHFKRLSSIIITVFLFIVLITSAYAGTVTVNPDEEETEISPYIYGVNSGVNLKTMKAKLFRLGGNRFSAYNWENNLSNAGSDWFYSTDGYLDKMKQKCDEEGRRLPDVLGVFAENNVYFATLWSFDENKFQISAINMYTNYDGKGSSFGNPIINKPDSPIGVTDNTLEYEIKPLSVTEFVLYTNNGFAEKEKIKQSSNNFNSKTSSEERTNNKSKNLSFPSIIALVTALAVSVAIVIIVSKKYNIGQKKLKKYLVGIIAAVAVIYIAIIFFNRNKFLIFIFSSCHNAYGNYWELDGASIDNERREINITFDLTAGGRIEEKLDNIEDTYRSVLKCLKEKYIDYSSYSCRIFFTEGGGGKIISFSGTDFESENFGIFTRGTYVKVKDLAEFFPDAAKLTFNYGKKQYDSIDELGGFDNLEYICSGDKFTEEEKEKIYEMFPDCIIDD